MHRRILSCFALCATVLALQAVPASATAQNEAARAVEVQLNMLVDGQAGLLWKQLHPAQQALVPQDRYVRCASKNTGGVELKDFEIKDVYRETVTIPGTTVKAKGYAVTVRYTLQQGMVTQPNTDTFHEYKVGKRWRFTVPDPTRAVDC